MAHHKNVWREAGNYGPGGRFEAQKNLGRHVFNNDPRPGQQVTINGQNWLVSKSEPAVLYVVPLQAS